MDDYKTRKIDTVGLITFSGGNIYFKRRFSNTKVWIGDKNTPIDIDAFWELNQAWKEDRDTNTLSMFN